MVGDTILWLWSVASFVTINFRALTSELVLAILGKKSPASKLPCSR